MKINENEFLKMPKKKVQKSTFENRIGKSKFENLKSIKLLSVIKLNFSKEKKKLNIEYIIKVNLQKWERRRKNPSEPGLES